MLCHLKTRWRFTPPPHSPATPRVITQYELRNTKSRINSQPSTKMNTTRTGKIARLPKYHRHELSRRLENGESGAKIVAWLNDDENVQEVLEEYFNGHPITEQNLSEWRQ